MTYQVSVTESIPHTVLRLRRQLHGEQIAEDIADGMRELFERAAEAALTPSGSPAITYLGAFGGEKPIDAEFTVPIGHMVEVSLSDDVEVVRQEAATVAHTQHHGDYREIGAAYQALDEWIRLSGRRAAGAPTEIYLVGPDEATDPHDLLTEIRIPVSAKEETT